VDNINADQNAVTHLKYINSERDLSLPLDKQNKTMDKYLDSQEEGWFKVQLVINRIN